MIYLYILKWFEGVYLANSILSVFWDTTTLSLTFSHTLYYYPTLNLYFCTFWLEQLNISFEIKKY